MAGRRERWNGKRKFRDKTSAREILPPHRLVYVLVYFTFFAFIDRYLLVTSFRNPIGLYFAYYGVLAYCISEYGQSE